MDLPVFPTKYLYLFFFFLLRATWLPQLNLLDFTSQMFMESKKFLSIESVKSYEDPNPVCVTCGRE